MNHDMNLCGPLPWHLGADPEDHQWWPSCSCGWNVNQDYDAGTLYFDDADAAKAAHAEHLKTTAPVAGNSNTTTQAKETK